MSVEAGLSDAPLTWIGVVAGGYLVVRAWRVLLRLPKILGREGFPAQSAVVMNSPNEKLQEYIAFIATLVSTALVAAVIWSSFFGSSFAGFIDFVKISSLIILSIVNVGIAHGDDNAFAKYCNRAISTLSVVLAVGIAIKAQNGGLIPLGQRSEMEVAISGALTYAVIVPLAAYAGLDLFLMRQTTSATLSERSLTHQRDVARRFFVYCDMPAGIALGLMILLATLWPYQAAEATTQVLSGAMGFVVISHAICSKAVDIYCPSEPTPEAHVKRIEGKIDPARLTRLQISMHNPSCSGGALLGMVEWLRVQGVSRLEFQVADALHRHNLRWQSRLSDEGAYAAARLLGDTWLAENREVLEYAVDNFDAVSVRRWDQWIRQEEFREFRATIVTMAETDGEFEAALRTEAEEYFSRSKRTLTLDRWECAREFLIEEIAVTEMCAHDELSNEVYPGSRFRPEVYLCERVPKRLKLSRLNYVNVDV